MFEFLLLSLVGGSIVGIGLYCWDKFYDKIYNKYVQEKSDVLLKMNQD